MHHYAVKHPVWYNKLIHHYLNQWDGTIQSNDTFSLLLETYKNELDFQDYLVQFKQFIHEKNPPPGFQRTERTYLFFDAYYVSYTKEFTSLNAILDSFTQKKSADFSFSSLLIGIKSTVVSAGKFIKEHPVEAMAFFLALRSVAMIHAMNTNAHQCENNSPECTDITSKSMQLQLNTAPQDFHHHFDHLNQYNDFELQKIKEEIIKIQIFSFDINDIELTVSPLNIERIRIALAEISNSKTIQLMTQNNVRIYIVTEEKMQEMVKMEEFSGCFIQKPYNCIALNEHIFKNWNQLSKNHLTTILANEISHATIHNTHTILKERQHENQGFTFLVPWTNELEKKSYLHAYGEFKKRVKKCKRLHSKHRKGQPCTAAEQKILDAFDACIMSYIPPQYGSDHYTAIQTPLSMKKDTLVILKDLEHTEPSLSQSEERKFYLIDAFFQEIKNKEIQNEVVYKHNMGIYKANTAEDQIAADELSDFETLPPNMRELLGSELCEYLSTFLQSPDHCNRKGWPR